MPKSRKIYLDYSASISANPSSIHTEGVKAKIKLQNARKKTAVILGARPEEIIFTSGGTESNNLAIQGVIFAWQKKISEKKLPHIITTNIEHPSVLETYKMLERRKLVEISIVPVEKNGITDPKKIKKEIKKNTVLISVMYANNEIGTIQPIREIAREIRHYKKHAKNLSFYPLFHTDAVQAANYLDINIEKLGVDLLSLSGTKLEGAGRIGVLFKRKSVPLTAVFGGGDQEMGLRPGTENLPAILKFSNALKSIQKNKEKEAKHLAQLRDHFFEKLQEVSKPVFDKKMSRTPLDAEVFINGDIENRLPNNINITFPKIPSDLLVMELSARGIMTSSKSACKSSRRESSYVIQALRSESNSEIGGVRFSLGKKTTKKDINHTIKILSKVLLKLKKWYN